MAPTKRLQHEDSKQDLLDLHSVLFSYQQPTDLNAYFVCTCSAQTKLAAFPLGRTYSHLKVDLTNTPVWWGIGIAALLGE